MSAHRHLRHDDELLAGDPRPLESFAMRRRPSWPRRVGAGLGVLAAMAAAAVVAAGPGTPAGAAPVAAAPDDAQSRQAALVAAEDRRLSEIRSVTSVAPLQGGTAYAKPYRLTSGAGYTLVLTSRKERYTVADLLTLAPQTFVRQGDGSYLLLENIYLNQGAKLLLSNPGGLRIRMASASTGFVSIVSFGGELTLAGSQQAPLAISSWDSRTRSADTDPTDGRAYVRAIGGQFRMSYAKVADLGFWSGRTGGIALTGTDRPNTGSTTGPEAPKGKTARDAAKEAENGPASPSQVPRAGDVYAQPSGKLTTPDGQYTVGGQSYVSAEIRNSTITGGAYGLFVSSADGIQISDTAVDHSLVDGVIMHRFASNGVIERVTSNDNAGDGFVLARATQEIRVSGVTANGNGGNGLSMSGRALADGPSPSGETVGGFGNSSVANSQFHDNGRYGIEIDGGTNLGVQNNTVSGGDMGIVARRGADKVSVVGNQVSGTARHGISIRDGVTAATVTGNTVESTPTGIYLRSSVGTVRGNTIDRVTLHGVTVAGPVKGTQVAYNTVSGTGPTAIDASRADGRIKVERNQTGGWHDTRSLLQQLRHWARPMTLLWLGVALLVVLSAVRSRKLGAKGSHPYAKQAPLPIEAGEPLAPGRPAPAEAELVGAGAGSRQGPPGRRTPASGSHPPGPRPPGPYLSASGPSGPHASGAHASGAHASGPHASVPHASGPHASGPHASGLHASGLHASGPHPSASRPSGPHVSGPLPSGPHPSGPHPSASQQGERRRERVARREPAPQRHGAGAAAAERERQARLQGPPAPDWSSEPTLVLRRPGLIGVDALRPAPEHDGRTGPSDDAARFLPRQRRPEDRP